MATFISNVGGYLLNPDALADCEFCGIQSSDQFLAVSFNIFYDNRWRDIAALVGFIGFNVSSSSWASLSVLTRDDTYVDHRDICFHLSLPYSHWKIPAILQKGKEAPKQGRQLNYFSSFQIGNIYYTLSNGTRIRKYAIYLD